MKTIIFDIDGTLFDTKDGIISCINYVLSLYNINAIHSKDEDKYIGPAIKDSLIQLNGFSEKDANSATETYRKEYVRKYIEQSKPYNGLFDLLSLIKKKNYNLCIATMKTKNQVYKLLNTYNILNNFDLIECAKYEGGYSKFDMLENIKQLFSGEFYFVGDTNGDYVASQKAKIKFIYASYGYGNISKVNGYIIGSLLDLKSIL